MLCVHVRVMQNYFMKDSKDDDVIFYLASFSMRSKIFVFSF